MPVFAGVTISGASLTIPRASGVSGAGYSGGDAGGWATGSDTSREVPRLWCRRSPRQDAPSPASGSLPLLSDCQSHHEHFGVSGHCCI